MSHYQFPLDEFYARVGVSDSGSVSIDWLEQLHRANVYCIPFENFDIQLGRGIDLSCSAVDAKLLRQQRGGYCFELNGLFLRALAASGFKARALLARVHLRGEPTGRTHQLGLVDLHGRDWIVDVGFGGGTLRAPIPLALNSPSEQDGIHYRLVEDPLGFMLQRQDENQWINLYSFDLCPVRQNDIILANYFTATHPQSLFTHYRMAVLCHPEGETRLLDYTCSTIRGGNTDVVTLPNSQQYMDELYTRFGIRIDAPYSALRPIEQTDQV